MAGSGDGRAEASSTSPHFHRFIASTIFLRPLPFLISWLFTTLPSSLLLTSVWGICCRCWVQGRADQPAGARSRQGSPGSRGGSPEDEDREPDIGERVTEAGKGALGLWLHLVDAWDPRKNIFSLWPRKGADRQRLPVLDGLRAVALGWLVIAVAYAGAFSTDAPTYLVASQYALNSDLARDILLLVSGMCISAVILAEVEDTCDFSIRRFYWRRFLALWPPLAVALLITYLFDPGARSSCRSAEVHPPAALPADLQAHAFLSTIICPEAQSHLPPKISASSAHAGKMSLH